MSKYATLSLDLNNANDTARKAVYTKLEEDGWHKMKPTTTLWYAPFNDSATDDTIVTATKKYVAAAAKAGKVSNYDATVSVGSKPVAWKATAV